MKFGYAEYPVLKMVDESTVRNTLKYFDGDEELGKMIRLSRVDEDLNLIKKLSKGRIDYLTAPFLDAIWEAKDSLVKAHAWDNIESQAGVLLNLPEPFTALSIAYYIEYNGEHRGASMLVFQKDTFVARIFSSTDETVGGEVIISPVWKQHFLDWYKKLSKLNEDKLNETSDKLFSWIYTELVKALNFIKYARVETKYIPANSRVKDIDCKYVNQTKANIRILNSKWFTTLVKSDAFKVRGHFRLQPYGEGLKQKKLIWINDFEKTGYTAPAQKLKNG